MSRNPGRFLAEAARRWSLVSGVAACILIGGALTALVYHQSAALAESATRGTLMETLSAIDLLEAEMIAQISLAQGDIFSEFITQSELSSRAEMLEGSLAAVVGKLPKVPERLREELVALIGGHIASMRHRVSQLKPDLVEVQELRGRLFGTVGDLVQAPDVGPDVYAAQAEVAALLQRYAQGEASLVPEGIVSAAVASLRNAAANSPSRAADLASEFAVDAALLAERQVAVHRKLGELGTIGQERRRDIDLLVGALEAELLDAPGPTAMIVLAVVLVFLLVAAGALTVLAAARLRDAGGAPRQGPRPDPTTVVVSSILADRVAEASGQILQHMSFLRRLPQYSRGSGTTSAQAVQSARVLGVAIERIAAGLARFAETATPASTGGAVALAPCVACAVAAARKLAGAGVAFEILDGDMRVLSSPDDLRLILDNVLTNAVEAADGEIRTSQVRVSVEVDSGRGEAAVVVSDNGPGVTEQIQKRAFDLFYTTKPNRVGVGLPVAQRLVLKWGGSMSISRSGGSGATVRISLPVATDQDPKAIVRRDLGKRILRRWADSSTAARRWLGRRRGETQ